jgi:hypothetical protein
VKDLHSRVDVKGLPPLVTMQRAAAAQLIPGAAPQFVDPAKFQYRHQRHPLLDGCKLDPIRHPASGSLLGPPPQLLALVLLQQLHVQVAGGFDPVLVDLAASARTSRRQLAAFGKIRTTNVRRLSSSLIRSSMLVDFICLWCSAGSR